MLVTAPVPSINTNTCSGRISQAARVLDVNREMDLQGIVRVVKKVTTSDHVLTVVLLPSGSHVNVYIS